MPIQSKAKTKTSTIGQVILPKAMRDKHRWTQGTALNVAETPDGVLLTAARRSAPTKFEDVFGCLGSVDRTFSEADIHKAVLAEARRRHARD
jgi:bifunctional DNA-binding transcriptional regulator/antitoxin component of YhaV-PrlF toxin-antitoxin module